MSERAVWLEEQSKLCPESRDEIMQFIADLRFRNGMKESRLIQNLCTAGCCYYFASMLQDIFGLQPYVIYESKHVIALDTNGVAYDINGVYDIHSCSLISTEDLSEESLNEIKCGSPY